MPSHGYTVVARVRIDAGTRITANMLDTVQVPEKYAHRRLLPPPRWDRSVCFVRHLCR
jgi:hypothetical protein